RDYPAMESRKLDNAAIAGRLDAFASLLELAGAGPYTARAYRRAADLIRTTPAPIAELVRAGRVRELRGIGPGIERRLRDLGATRTAAADPESQPPAGRVDRRGSWWRGGRRPAALAGRVRAARRRLLGGAARPGARPVRGPAADRHRGRARRPASAGRDGRGR